MPRVVAAAFEEVFDLHRATSGGDVPIAAFIEALIAETAAHPTPPDAPHTPDANATGDANPAGHNSVAGANAAGDFDPKARLENVLARATNRWAHLIAEDAREALARSAVAASRTSPSDVEPPDVEPVGAAAAQLDDESGVSAGAQELENQLLWLLQLESARERRLGRLLYEMDMRGDWRMLGFGSVGHYAVERLGIARRTIESRVGIVRALRRLPVVDHAYETGRIGLESAWLLVRIFGSTKPDSALQHTWVDHAERVSVKRLRDEWRWLCLRDLTMGPHEANRGAGGADAGASGGAGGRAGTNAGASADAAGNGGTNVPMAPHPASDEEWYASLHRSPGRSRERLRAMRIVAAQPGHRDGGAHDRRQASADVCLRLRLPVDLARAFLSAIESARQRTDAIAAAVPWHEPWAAETPASIRAAHAFAEGVRGSPPWVGLLAMLEDYVDIWDDPRGFPRREWDAIYSRAGWRCEAPGCTARVRIEDHHILYRSRQGSNDAWNQLCLCRAHHQQGEHGESARCRGRAPLDVLWRLGKKGVACWYRNEVRLDGPDGRS